MTDQEWKWIRITGILGIVFALISCMADLALLYNPEGGYLVGDYAFLQGFSSERMAVGHYLGIFFIPAQLIGLWPVHQGLKPMGKKYGIGLLVLGVYIAYPGVAYHGSVAYIAEGINHVGPDHVEGLKVFSEPLAGFFILGFIALSILFLIPVAKGKSAFPKWMAIFNPFSIYIIILLLFFLVPVIGNPLLVAGFNLALAIFFLMCLLTFKRNALSE